MHELYKLLGLLTIYSNFITIINKKILYSFINIISLHCRTKVFKIVVFEKFMYLYYSILRK